MLNEEPGEKTPEYENTRAAEDGASTPKSPSPDQPPVEEFIFSFILLILILIARRDQRQRGDAGSRNGWDGRRGRKTERGWGNKSKGREGGGGRGKHPQHELGCGFPEMEVERKQSRDRASSSSSSSSSASEKKEPMNEEDVPKNCLFARVRKKFWLFAQTQIYRLLKQSICSRVFRRKPLSSRFTRS